MKRKNDSYSLIAPSYSYTFSIVLLMFFCATFLCSCFSFKTKDKNGNVVSHHFGYTRFEAPSSVSKNTVGDFKVNDIRTWGIRIERGVGIGYSRERNEYIPMDCRLVIRVANEEQMEKAQNLLTNLEKEGLCVTVDKNN